MTRKLLALAAVLSLSLGACTSGTTDAPPKPDPTTVATAATTAGAPVKPLLAAPGKGACGGGSEACGDKNAGSHEPSGACGDTANVQDTTITTATDPTTGATISLVGTKLSGLPAVKVADLIANPDQYAGKTIRVEGDVSAMCTHRRGWFAVQDAGEKAGTHVRILTAPSFLVPPGSIGKKARTEGRVEVINVDPEAARHYAEGHKLKEQNAKDQPNKSVVIRAVGAEFI